jgi:Ser/Thr protein kinase RdoA (MazF antagonist)
VNDELPVRPYNNKKANSLTCIGYTSVTPLELEELEVLVDLIEARLVAFLMIAQWRATIHPDNAAYIFAGSEVTGREQRR